MKNIRITSPSRNGTHLINTDEFLKQCKTVENKFGVETKTNFFKNNGTGLSRIFNSEIDKAKEDGTDFLMLVHSDVSFDYFRFMEKYLKVCGKYDVVGFAGTRKIDLSISPLTWFTGSKNFPNERYGRVIHREFNLGESFFNGQHHADADDVEVGTIDGLCLVLNRKAIESGARFDERFTFDFYDLDFCLTCIVKNGLKLGVIVEPVVHESVGTSVLKPEYLLEEKKFREKWCI